MSKNNKKSVGFILLDIFYITMAILPLGVGILLKLISTPPSDGGVTISGARVFWHIDISSSNFLDIFITEAQINSVLVIITILFVCLFLTHGLKQKIWLKRQHLAEIIIEKVDSMVADNMGEPFKAFPPFIIAIMALSAFSSLITLLGLFPPTSDINIVGGWAILVFIIITYYKMKCGLGYYIGGFMKPVFILAPINAIGEFATPVSMAFRHYGNVMSGAVISVLVSYFLGQFSTLIFGDGAVSVFQVGLPAILSLYFDIFSGCLQAFIFAMLTMLNISTAFDAEEYERRKKKKLEKKLKKINGGN